MGYTDLIISGHQTVWSKAAEINLSANLTGERCSALTALESGRYDKYVSSPSPLSPAVRSVVLIFLLRIAVRSYRPPLLDHVG